MDAETGHDEGRHGLGRVFLHRAGLQGVKPIPQRSAVSWPHDSPYTPASAHPSLNEVTGSGIFLPGLVVVCMDARQREAWIDAPIASPSAPATLCRRSGRYFTNRSIASAIAARRA